MDLQKTRWLRSSNLSQWFESSAKRPIALAARAVVEPLERKTLLSSEFIFPSNAGVLNAASFGATPNDGTDDTAAIQAALNYEPAGHRVIYLPNGVYNVSNTLQWPEGTVSGQYDKYTTLQGESTAGVVLQLPNSASGFTDTNNPKAVIFTGVQPAQRFGNYVRNLTINVGSGNAGAIGLQFNASNNGGIRDVKIVSSDHQGKYGLDMGYTGEIGPLFVKNLTVDGFDQGIRTYNNEASQTFEHIVLRNQNQYGIFNQHQSIFIRDLQSTNSVPALINNWPQGAVTLIDSTLTGIGGASTQPAIIHSPNTITYLRNVSTSGYQKVVRNDENASNNVAGPNASEWSSDGIHSLFSGPATSLNLPAKETPSVALDTNFANWADPRSYGAVAGDGIDDTAAIQAAIDSGKSTVFFQSAQLNRSGEYVVNGTLHVRGNVSRLIGFAGVITGSGTVRFEDGAAPTVVAERIDFGYFSNIKIEVDTTRTVVLSSGSVDKGITKTNTGDLFLEDFVSGGQIHLSGGTTYGRQVDPEVPGTHILVDNGARFWALGVKSEVAGTVLDVEANSTAEVLGMFVYTSFVPDQSPIIIINNGRFSGTVREMTHTNQPYPNVVRETRGGTTLTLTNTGQNPIYMGLYTGYPSGGTVTVPNAPSALSASAASASAINLTWADNSSDETGFKIERKTGSGGTWAQIATTGAGATSYGDSGLSASTAYYYRVRATNAAGDSAYTAEANATTTSGATAPAAPSGLTVVGVSSTQINLSWTDNASNETGFKIERKTGAGGTYSQIATPGANVTSYNDTGLTAGTLYYYRVRATNAIGDSAYSAESSATTSAGSTGLPSGWSNGDIGGPGVAGSTTYDSAAASFTVNGSGGDIWGTSDQFQFASQTTSGDVTLVARLTSFTNAGGYAKAGVMIRASTAADAPFAYMIVGGNGQLNFLWRSASGAAANQQGWVTTTARWIKIARVGNVFTGSYSTDGTNWTALGSTTITMGTATNTGLAVTATNNTLLSNGTFSNVAINATGTGGATAPAAPSNLSASAASSTAINLSWADNSSDETGFKIERKIGSGGTYVQIGTVSAGVTTYGDTGLSASTQYYYRVRATNAAGDSAYAAEANATTSAGSGSPGLPAGWTGSDVGSPGVAGSTTYDSASGTYTVAGSGGDIWNTSDQFQFSNRDTSGDTTVVAKLASFTNAGGYAKAGVMIRAGLAAGDPYALMEVGGSGQINFQWRTSSGAAAIQQGWITSAARWLKIVRVGNVFTGSYSGDGSTWTQFATATITMTAAVKVGLAVTAANNTQLATAAFTNVAVNGGSSATAPAAPTSLSAAAASASQINLSWADNSSDETGFKIERKTGAGGTYAQIATTSANATSFSDTGLAGGTLYYYRVRATNAAGDSAYTAESSATTSTGSTGLPSGWSSGDIGSPTTAGSTTYNGSTFSVNGAGSDIWGTSDQFQSAAVDRSGDTTVTAKLDSFNNAGGYAKAGVMIRAGSGAGDAYAMIEVGGNGQINFQWRTATGAAANQQGWITTSARWLRIARVGSTFTGYYSVDGSSWTQFASASITMASSVRAGLAVSSANPSSIASAIFSSVTV